MTDMKKCAEFWLRQRYRASRFNRIPIKKFATVNRAPLDCRSPLSITVPVSSAAGQDLVRHGPQGGVDGDALGVHDGGISPSCHHAAGDRLAGQASPPVGKSIDSRQRLGT
jgi:hypothetical protein